MLRNGARKGKKWLLMSLILGFFLTAPSIEASTIQKCSPRITKKGHERWTCRIRLEDGNVSNNVVVLNTRALTAAKGVIVARKPNSPYADIVLTEIYESVRKGYPVIVAVDSKYSSAQYAAAVAD